MTNSNLFFDNQIIEFYYKIEYQNFYLTRATEKFVVNIKTLQLHNIGTAL